MNAETNKRNELIQAQLKILYDQQQQQLQEQYLKSHLKMTNMYPTNNVPTNSFNFPNQGGSGSGSSSPRGGPSGGMPNMGGIKGHPMQHQQQPPPQQQYYGGHPQGVNQHNPYASVNYGGHMGGMGGYQQAPHQMSDMNVLQQQMMHSHSGAAAAAAMAQKRGMGNMMPQAGVTPATAMVDKKRRKAGANQPIAPVDYHQQQVGMVNPTYGHYPVDPTHMADYGMNMYGQYQQHPQQTSSVATSAAAAGKRQPPSAYITFCTMKRTEVRTIFPDASFGDLGKILGMLWGAMSEESRAEYMQIAQSVEENQKSLNQLGGPQQQQLHQQQQNDWSLRCKLPTAFALFCEGMFIFVCVFLCFEYTTDIFNY